MASLRNALFASLLSSGAWASPTEPSRLAPTEEATESNERTALSALLGEARVTLDELGVHGVVSGRIKSPLSIHRKALRKGLPPDDVLDRVGVRIVVPTVAECYEVMAHLDGRLASIDGSADDYIAHPKANGYRSLHRAFDLGGSSGEVQVRTFEMHAAAEWGSASHTRYKAAQDSELFAFVG